MVSSLVSTETSLVSTAAETFMVDNCMVSSLVSTETSLVSTTAEASMSTAESFVANLMMSSSCVTSMTTTESLVANLMVSAPESLVSSAKSSVMSSVSKDNGHGCSKGDDDDAIHDVVYAGLP